MKRLAFAAYLLLCAGAVPLRAQESRTRPVAVPFEVVFTKHMLVKVTINGKGPYRMIFDTGAPVSLVSSKVAKEAGLLSKNPSRPAFSLFGPAAPTKIKALEIGALKADSVPIIVMDHPTVQVMARFFGPIEGILGFPFFARYRMTLDYQSQQMTFVPSGFEPADILQTLTAALMAGELPAKRMLAPAGLWGLVVDKKANDEEAGVAIKEVLPASASARAGLKAGDRLLTLDDRWTDSPADCYAAASYIKPGTEAKVVIKRAGKELELTVKPEKGL